MSRLREMVSVWKPLMYGGALAIAGFFMHLKIVVHLGVLVMLWPVIYYAARIVWSVLCNIWELVTGR